MEHEAYVAARRARLVEHAVALGCPAEDAEVEVDRVLEDRRRLIATSEDPDPGVRAALERRLAGESEPPPARPTWAWAVVAVAALAGLAAAAVLLGRPERLAPVPSLFGYDLAAATRALSEAGYAVESETAAACEPRGLVLGSEPVPGSQGSRGDTVVVRTAVPADPACLATYGFRSDAWDFVAFVRGGDAPVFAPRVEVFLNGAPEAALSADGAADPSSWGEALQPVVRAAAAVAPTRSAMPRLDVDSLVPDPALCGVVVPGAYADRLTLRLTIDPSPDGTAQLCPVTVDLYRDEEGRIEAVSLFSGTASR